MLARFMAGAGGARPREGWQCTRPGACGAEARPDSSVQGVLAIVGGGTVAARGSLDSPPGMARRGLRVVRICPRSFTW